MKTIISYISYFLIGSFCLFSYTSWSQENTDSIIAFAKKQIYENPNHAIETAKALKNSPDATIDTKVEALIIISTAYSSKREYEKSLDYSLEALDMLPKIEDIELKIKLLNRIGSQYQEIKVYDKALTYLDQAYKTLKTIPESTEKTKLLGINNLSRGFIYRDQMSCEIALDYFNNAIEAYQELIDQSQVNYGLSIAFYNKGNRLFDLNRINAAEDSFLQAIIYAKKNNSKSLIAFAQKGLARVPTIEGDHKKAINILFEALQNSEEVGDKILNGSIYTSLAQNYLAENDLKNYSLYQNKSQFINKEIIKTERKTIDNSIQNIMEVNSKKNDDFRTRNTLFRAILILLIVAVIGFIIRSVFTSDKTLKSLKKELKL